MGMLLLNGSTDLNPRELFANNEQGLWLDPSQLSTLYQDSNGVTPCTAAGDPVGLILDQSRGGLSQIGADLVTNGGFDSGSSWTIAGGTPPTISGGTANWSAATGSITSSSSIVSGKWYRLTFDLVSYTSGTLAFRDGTTNTTIATTGAVAGSKSFIILATGTNIAFHSFSAATLTIDNISIREVPGNHAYQTTSASRPTLARIPSSGRRNLLTYSEQFDNAAWTKLGGSISANQITDPLAGQQTVDLFTEDSGTSNHGCSISYTATAGANTFSMYVKYDSHPFFELVLDTSDGNAVSTFNLTNGTVNSNGPGATGAISALGNGWYRCAVTYTLTAGTKTARFRGGTDSVTYFYAGNSSRKTYIWGAQIETGSTASNYQKVVATTDVTESGVGDLWHLVFDGSDDSLVTNSVDFTATDEMTVIAGVRKLSDAADGNLLELTANTNSNTGSFYIWAPEVGVAAYASLGRGTQAASINQRAAMATGTAPDTAVVAVSHDISGDLSSIRRNGVAGTAATGEKGSGNFANAALYIGRRGGSSQPYNGHLYQLIIRGKTTPTGKLLEAERFVGRKTGVSF